MAVSKLYKAVVTEKDGVADRIIRLTIDLKDPAEMEFVPGQFVNIKVGESSYRSYSIASNNTQKDRLIFYILLVDGGNGSDYINKLDVGNSIELIGPSGCFGLQSNLSNCLVFICTSTGLAPFISIFYELERIEYTGSIVLLFGLRTHEEEFAMKELNHFKSILKNFNYGICLSREGNKSEDYFNGRVTDLLPSYIDSDVDTQYYICGNPNMVKEAIDVLEASKVPKESIIHEKFSRRWWAM